MLKPPDPVRWFNNLGRCQECPKPAVGSLRGPRNESYGIYCQKCADRRLVKAEAERARFAVQQVTELSDGMAKEIEAL